MLSSSSVPYYYSQYLQSLITILNIPSLWFCRQYPQSLIPILRTPSIPAHDSCPLYLQTLILLSISRSFIPILSVHSPWLSRQYPQSLILYPACLAHDSNPLFLQTLILLSVSPVLNSKTQSPVLIKSSVSSVPYSYPKYTESLIPILSIPCPRFLFSVSSVWFRSSVSSVLILILSFLSLWFLSSESSVLPYCPHYPQLLVSILSVLTLSQTKALFLTSKILVNNIIISAFL